MNRLAAAAARVRRLLKTYPALSAALVNFGVFAAGYFGLNLTADELIAFAGVFDLVFGAIVHSQVTPVAKLPEKGK